MTLEEKYSGKKPNVEHLKVFVCIAFCHIPKEHKKNLIVKDNNISLWDMMLLAKSIDFMTPIPGK